MSPDNANVINIPYRTYIVIAIAILFIWDFD